MFFDPATVEAVRDIAPVWLVLLLTLLSFLGSTFYQVPLLFTIYVLEARERTATWLAIVAGSYSFRSLLKALNDVERPPVDPPLDAAVFPPLIRPIYDHPANIDTTSFPSGHVIAATVLWGLLVMDTDIGTRRQRLAVAVNIVFIVALSRVVLGAHYIEDVVAGAIFGLLFLAIVVQVRSLSTRPVPTMFALAGFVSVLTLLVGQSTTGSVVLGVSIGVIAVYSGPDFIPDFRERHSRFGVVEGGAAVMILMTGALLLNIIIPLFVLGLVAGAIGIRVPRHPRIRAIVPSRAKIT